VRQLKDNLQQLDAKRPCFQCKSLGTNTSNLYNLKELMAHHNDVHKSRKVAKKKPLKPSTRTSTQINTIHSKNSSNNSSRSASPANANRDKEQRKEKNKSKIRDRNKESNSKPTQTQRLCV
jgi:hypothetical protein